MFAFAQCGRLLAWEPPAMEKLDGYLRIKEAAEYLSGSPNTPPKWGRDGKITAQRHPTNNFPLCKKTESRPPPPGN